ncbi:MAG: hypothetical protein J1E03_04365 [Acetatifactor sp.]|nr:hypothetical protein [Acetatifactor sp.]
MGSIIEYDRLSPNNILLNDVAKEQTLTDTTYKQFEMKQKEMRVIFEFPEKADDEELIKQEVKSILVNALQERVHKIS